MRSAASEIYPIQAMNPQQTLEVDDQVKLEISTYWDYDYRDDIFNPPQYPKLLEEVIVRADDPETRKTYMITGIKYTGGGQEYLYCLRALKRITGQINWAAEERWVEEEEIMLASEENLSPRSLAEENEESPF